VPVRIAFIGVGGIAAKHLSTLEQIPDAQPVAFCDVDRERAKIAARRFGGKAYLSARRMLEKESLDAVYVCLPPHAHKDAEILAAQKGCALFIEKPISQNLRTAERNAHAIEEAGVIASVGYHFRYHEATIQAQSLLGKNAPAMIYGRWLGGFPGAPWWRKMEQSGGQLHEQATHIVDLARYLVGEVKKVYCCAAQREMHKTFRDSDAPDVTALTLEFQNGAIGHLATACLLGGVGEVGLSLYLKDAIYDLHGNTLSLRQSGETRTFTHRNDPYVDEDATFIEAVKSGKRAAIKSDYADALKTLRVTLAANQSAKSGKPVTL
jgi:predicted dehydrogenase